MRDDSREFRNVVNRFADDGSRSIMRVTRRFTKGKKTPYRIKTVYVPNKKNATIQFDVGERKLSAFVEGNVKTTGRRRKARFMIQFKIAYHSSFLENGQGKGIRKPEPFLDEALNRPLTKLADQTGEIFADKTIRTMGSFAILGKSNQEKK